MPKKVEKKALKEKVSHEWECPDCGAKIKHEFKSKDSKHPRKLVHEIKIGSQTSYAGDGVWEAMIVTCPNCDCDIEFTREELEAPSNI